MAEEESRILAMNAYGSLTAELKSKNMDFGGVRLARGMADGIKSQYSVVRDTLKDTVSGAIEDVRSMNPGELFTLIPQSMDESFKEIKKQFERFEGFSNYNGSTFSKWRRVLLESPNDSQSIQDNTSTTKKTDMLYTQQELNQKSPIQINIDGMQLAEILLSPLDLLQGKQYESQLFIQGGRR